MQLNYVLQTSFDEGLSPIEPVALSEMKTYLIVSPSETFNDVLITENIKTARLQLEGYLNISLIDKTVIARLQNDAGYMLLPYTAPVITITSVSDDSGNVVSSDNYSLKGDTFCGYSKAGTPANNFYSSCNNIVNVVYDVAYTDGIPVHFKTAIMQQVAWLYQRGRGDELESAISPIVKISLKPYRKVF